MCIAVVHGILDKGCGDAPAGAIIDVLASRMAADLCSPHELTYRAKLEQLLDDMEERLRRGISLAMVKARARWIEHRDRAELRRAIIALLAGLEE